MLWREWGCKGRQQLENGILKQDHFGEANVDNKTADFPPVIFSKYIRGFTKKIIIQIMIYRGCVGLAFAKTLKRKYN